MQASEHPPVILASAGIDSKKDCWLSSRSLAKVAELADAQDSGIENSLPLVSSWRMPTGSNPRLSHQNSNCVIQLQRNNRSPATGCAPDDA